jgi:hypothetical protein
LNFADQAIAAPTGTPIVWRFQHSPCGLPRYRLFSSRALLSDIDPRNPHKREWNAHRPRLIPTTCDAAIEFCRGTERCPAGRDQPQAASIPHLSTVFCSWQQFQQVIRRFNPGNRSVREAQLIGVSSPKIIDDRIEYRLVDIHIGGDSPCLLQVVHGDIISAADHSNGDRIYHHGPPIIPKNSLRSCVRLATFALLDGTRQNF